MPTAAPLPLSHRMHRWKIWVRQRIVCVLEAVGLALVIPPVMLMGAVLILLRLGFKIDFGDDGQGDGNEPRRSEEELALYRAQFHVARLALLAATAPRIPTLREPTDAEDAC